MSRLGKFVLLVAMIAVPWVAVADESCGLQRGETGKFDYYLLALSWSPSFCATAAGARAPQQCDRTAPERGFVVHGLWPQYSDGSWPQCCSAAPFRAEAVPPQLDGRMIGDALRRHEWQKHGACATPLPDDYFAAIARAVTAMGTADAVQPGQTGRISIRDLKRHWQVPAAAIVPRCRKGALSEVRICLDRDLAAIPCPASVRKDDNCPGTVILPAR